MDNQYYFAGTVRAKLTDSYLSIHPKVKFSHSGNSRIIPSGQYIVAECVSEKKFHYLAMLPKDYWVEKSQSGISIDDVLTDDTILDQKDLKTTIRNKGAHTLRLPESSLQHLGIGSNSKVVVKGMLDYFEIWKPEDLEEYMKKCIFSKSSEDLEMALSNIGV